MLDSFFEKLTDAQRASIVAVGIDRAGAYQASVETWLPQADIVYDRFHLVANVNQAVDEVLFSKEWRWTARGWAKASTDEKSRC
jgi:transposase